MGCRTSKPFIRQYLQTQAAGSCAARKHAARRPGEPKDRADGKLEVEAFVHTAGYTNSQFGRYWLQAAKVLP